MPASCSASEQSSSLFDSVSEVPGHRFESLVRRVLDGDGDCAMMRYVSHFLSQEAGEEEGAGGAHCLL